MMMCCVGAIVRSGDRKQKATLLAVIRQCAALSRSVDHPHPRSSYPGVVVEGVQTLPLFPETANGEDVSPADLGRYATALKEYGDQHGFAPEYSVRHLSSAPSLFQARVTFDGRRFEGTARNKKQSRHQAASEACSYLGIDT